MVVVLPAPLGPRNPCTSPVRTSSSSPSRARVGPKDLTSPEIEMAVAIGGCRLLWRSDGRSPGSDAPGPGHGGDIPDAGRRRHQRAGWLGSAGWAAGAGGPGPAAG